MKKFMAILLVLALASLMGLSAMAEPITSLPGDQDIEVKGTFVDGGNDPTAIYSVDVSWGSLVFTYTGASKKWNPSTHTYDIPNEDGAWSIGENQDKITVTNHSNAAVPVAFEFDAEEGFTGTVEAGEFEGTLASAVGTAVESAPNVTATVAITGGTLSSGTEIQIGTVTVTLGAAE